MHLCAHRQRMRDGPRTIAGRMALFQIECAIRLAETFNIWRLLREWAKGWQASGVWQGRFPDV
jgi:hypothetical protein